MRQHPCKCLWEMIGEKVIKEESVAYFGTDLAAALDCSQIKMVLFSHLHTFGTRILKLFWQTNQCTHYRIEDLFCQVKSEFKCSFGSKLAAICIEIYWKILTFLLVLTLENVYEHLLSAEEWNYLFISQWRASKKLNRFQEKIGCTNITVKVNRPIKQKQSVISALNVNTCGLFSSPYAKNSGLTFKCAFVLVTAAIQSSIHIWHLWWAILSQLAKDLCPFHILPKNKKQTNNEWMNEWMDWEWKYQIFCVPFDR